jgi:probable rRNA maturation factor
VALVSDLRIRTLNRTYRRKDTVTDVLSFPPDSADRGPRTSDRGPRTADRGRFLGDVAIAKGVAARQAWAAGHSIGTELRVLALHGLLHLMGYDHERDRGEMRRLETRLRRKGGLKESLIERTR